MLDRNAVSLEDKVALITGGGAGIGRAIAETFAAHGAAVVVADSAAQRAAETCAEIRARGGKALDVVVDVREPAAVEELETRAMKRFGGIDVLVNNVGHYLRASRFVDTGPADWDDLYRINLGHVFSCTRAFVPHMIERGEGGSVINISTIEAFRGVPGCAVYSAFNAAISGFTRSLALELGADGVRVNAIAPETTETLQVRPSLWVRPEHRELERYWIPLGRFGRPDDAAGCALFLASSLSAWVTGTTVHVDGGALAAGGFYRVPGGGWTNTPIVTGSGFAG